MVEPLDTVQPVVPGVWPITPITSSVSVASNRAMDCDPLKKQTLDSTSVWARVVASVRPVLPMTYTSPGAMVPVRFRVAVGVVAPAAYNATRLPASGMGARVGL